MQSSFDIYVTLEQQQAEFQLQQERHQEQLDGQKQVRDAGFRV